MRMTWGRVGIMTGALVALVVSAQAAGKLLVTVGSDLAIARPSETVVLDAKEVARTLAVDGQVVYAINVSAEDADVAAGCGAAGRTVTFQVGPQSMAATAAWDTRQLWPVDLQPAWRVYLPLMIKP